MDGTDFWQTVILIVLGLNQFWQGLLVKRFLRELRTHEAEAGLLGRRAARSDILVTRDDLL